jgi:hypothetical protein
MDTIQNYYELKQSYQENIDRRKKNIKKKDIPMKEKKTLIKQIIGKCVNCGKSGGTIFEEKNGLLKAVCGSTNQCDLNINIKRKVYENVRDIEIKNNKLIENLKLRIIMTKLDYLFGVNSSKDETVDKFNTLKHELASISETQLINLKKYGDIISGIHREPLLNDANMDLIREVDDLKQLYKKYQEEKTVVYLTAMVEAYITKIKPLTEKIRDMNYGYYALENDNDNNKDNSGKDNDEDADGGDGDGQKSKGVKSNKINFIYNLIARPYRFEQFEQEKI